MSREIKFRAWDEKNKQFADYEDIEECLSCQSRDGWRSSDGMGCCFGINAIEILAYCIIEQYTGLIDKNGKEIYEGDILETCCGEAEVYFDDELLMYKIKVKHGGTMPLVSKKSKRHFDYEIIGNIHENPELLGGEK